MTLNIIVQRKDDWIIQNPRHQKYFKNNNIYQNNDVYQKTFKIYVINNFYNLLLVYILI